MSADGAARPRLSVGLAPTKRVVEYARVAEALGYHRVWLYDSPALYGDVWLGVGRVAEATGMNVGTAVAVPSLRHPMVTAAAIASVEDLAPGRLVVAFGTGFTARIMLGQKPMRWADLARYLGQVRGLLAGDVVDIDGQACQMFQPEGFGPARPLATPLWAAPMGPKGFATAREIGVDGVMLTGLPPAGGGDWKDSAVIVSGTVVRPGEDHTSERLLAAAGPWFAVSFHGMWEYAPEALDVMAGGPEWRDAMLAARPERQRHLAVHEGHVVAPPARDVAAIRAAGPAIMESGWTGDAARVAERFAEVADAGVAEVVYCAAGPDIAGELEAFAAAVR